MKIGELIRSAQLPTLSRSLHEIIRLEEKNPASFFSELQKIVEKDPLLSVHILKVANSPFIGLPQKVHTIQHAVSLLGIQQVRNIAFSYSVFDFFKKVRYQPEYGATFSLIVKKSLLVSAVAAILARRKNLLNSDEILVAGLLVDIGQVLLFLKSPQKYVPIHAVLDARLIEREKAGFGFDHVELGAEVVRAWQLPDFLFNAIRLHTRDGEAEERALIVAVANRIAEWLLTEDEAEKRRLWADLESHAGQRIGLSIREIKDSIHRLPDVIDAYAADFPELQQDLRKTLSASSALIIALMQKEVDLTLHAQELSSAQERLVREKDLLSHLLNVSYFLSAPRPPLKAVHSLFEYFAQFVPGLVIEFVHYDPRRDEYAHHGKRFAEPRRLVIDDFPGLRKASLSGDVAVLGAAEVSRLELDPGASPIALPVAFHHTLFGFLLLAVAPGNSISEVEVSYVRILANILANSFQNHFSLQNLRKEQTKKDYLSRELLHASDEVSASRELAHQSQKNEIAGEILPVIFHKLKNKLTPVMGYAQILRLKTGDEFFIDRLDKIERNALELTDLLNILREQFRGGTPYLETAHVHAVIRAMRERLERLASSEGADLRIDLDERVPAARLNVAQMETLLAHLVENAVTAVRARPAAERIVSIRTRLDDEGWQLLVRDNGVGIPPGELAKVSSPFYSTLDGHAGLGLSICEKIVANHGGRMSIASAPGEYTEVEVDFPLPTTEPEPLPAARPAVVGRVLIIDDEEYLLELMKEVLAEETGLTVTTCGNSPQALQLLAEREFDAIILDIRMPELDGMEIYRELQNCGLASRVLVVSADPDAEDVAAFLEETKARFLQKPFELMKFREQVIDILR